MNTDRCHSTCHPRAHSPACQPTSQPTDQPTNRPANQSANQPANQPPPNQPADQPTRLRPNHQYWYVWRRRPLHIEHSPSPSPPPSSPESRLMYVGPFGVTVGAAEVDFHRFVLASRATADVGRLEMAWRTGKRPLSSFSPGLVSISRVARWQLSESI